MKRLLILVKDWYINTMRRRRALHLAQPGGRVIVVLLLALVVGSAGQPLPARAAPNAAAEIHFSLLAIKTRGNRIVCVGDTVPIRVKVMQSQMTGIQGDNVKSLPGVRVVASMSNEAVGQLNPISVDTGFDALDPGAIDFTLQAERVGTTTISFRAEIKSVWWGSKVLFWKTPLMQTQAILNASVDVKVEDCLYDVTVISQWTGAFAGTVPAGQDGFDQVAIINQAYMGLDSPGEYSGTADVNWVISETVPQGICPPHPVVFTSQADLFGTLDEGSQQLEVEVSYKMVEGRFPSYFDFYPDQCPLSGDAAIQYIPAPLRFSVPSYGGSKVLSQTIVDGLWGGGEFSGSVHVIVEPQSGQ